MSFNTGKFLIVTCMACIMTSLCACSSNTGKNYKDAKEQQSTEQKTQIPDHLNIKLNDYTTIDADVDIPESLQSLQMKKVKAHRPKLDESLVKEIFLPEKDIKSSYWDKGYKCREFGNYDILVCYGKNNEMLSFENSDIIFISEKIDYILNCVNTDKRFDSYNLDKYSLTKELSFMSREDAFKKIKSVYEQCGINISDEYKAYALDHVTLKEQEAPMDVDGNIVEEDKKNTWTKEDDSYYFILHQEVENIPIEQIAYGDGYEGIGIEETQMDAYYGTRGWEQFNMRWAYQLENTEDIIDIISPEDAVKSLQKKCDMLISSEDWSIETISLKLVPVFIKDNEYEIHPVWFFEGESKDSSGEEEARALSIMFDGITGQEIIQ